LLPIRKLVIDYAVILPSGVIEDDEFEQSSGEVLSTGVKLPSPGSLADLAVKAVLPDHEPRVLFGRRQLQVDSSTLDGLSTTLEILGSNVLVLTRLKEGRHGVETEVELWVSGLTTLGLAERVKPGTAEEIASSVRGAVRERLRKLILTELFYSMFREQYRQRSRSGRKHGDLQR
jgi:hypothetical protein